MLSRIKSTTMLKLLVWGSVSMGTAETGMNGSPLKLPDGGRLKSAKFFMYENGSLQM